jgi:hypothetical protein
MISGVPHNHPGEEWEVIEEEQVIIYCHRGCNKTVQILNSLKTARKTFTEYR